MAVNELFIHNKTLMNKIKKTMKNYNENKKNESEM